MQRGFPWRYSEWNRTNNGWFKRQTMWILASTCPRKRSFRTVEKKKKRISRLNLSFYSLPSGNTSDVELNISWEINKREAWFWNFSDLASSYFSDCLLKIWLFNGVLSVVDVEWRFRNILFISVRIILFINYFSYSRVYLILIGFFIKYFKYSISNLMKSIGIFF